MGWDSPCLCSAFAGPAAVSCVHTKRKKQKKLDSAIHLFTAMFGHPFSLFLVSIFYVDECKYVSWDLVVIQRSEAGIAIDGICNVVMFLYVGILGMLEGSSFVVASGEVFSLLLDQRMCSGVWKMVEERHIESLVLFFFFSLVFFSVIFSFYSE